MKREKYKNGGREAGFTLIEVLIVVVIIGFLASLVGPNLMDRIGEASQTAAENQISIFESALRNYYLDNGHYPTTEQGLEALVEEPTTSPVPDNWSGPYLDRNSVPEDPWGNEYNYKCPGDHNTHSFDIWTYGRNNQPGGEGEDADVTNWD